MKRLVTPTGRYYGFLPYQILPLLPAVGSWNWTGYSNNMIDPVIITTNTVFGTTSGRLYNTYRFIINHQSPARPKKILNSDSQHSQQLNNATNLAGFILIMTAESTT